MRVISWDEYFMGIAHLSAMRSKDPNTKVGACIVDKNNKILSVGYNGFPIGLSDDKFPWGREGGFKDTKYAYVVHAELNAILNSQRSVRGCTIYVSLFPCNECTNLRDSICYVTLFPCNECAKAIIQSGIKKVVYESDKYAESDMTLVSKQMLKEAGVELVQLDYSIDLNLNIR